MKMMKSVHKMLLLGCLVLTPTLVSAQPKEETEPVAASKLTGVPLPKGAERMLDRSVPTDLKNTLATLIKAGGEGVKQGRTEVLAWRGNGYSKARAPQLIKQVSDAIKKAGWEYNSDGSNPEFTLVSLTRTTPQRRALIGLLVPADDALVLAWSEMLAANPTPAEDATPAQNDTAANNAADNTNTAGATPAKPVDTPQTSTPTAATVLEVNAATAHLNVMKTTMPKIPTFSTLTPKPGFVRGYVKDSNGKPLQNARIGIRSTAVGGAYSGAQGKTDAKGYYEFAVPFGACHFYNAGYAVDYGEGRAALGLHPGNYYGGTFVLSWSVADERPVFASPSDLPPNSVIEITLTPQSPLINGSKGRTFVIRKTIGTWFGQLYVVNIPIATYKISAKLAGGGALKMKEGGPNGGTMFGIEPKEATGTATLYLRPSSAKAESSTPSRGNWEHVSITLSR
jgi:protocatechuate 3,4-dioxygenase beta subunit